MNIKEVLDLLKSIESFKSPGVGPSRCPSCGGIFLKSVEHEPGCKLKEMIDRLQSINENETSCPSCGGSLIKRDGKAEGIKTCKDCGQNWMILKLSKEKS